MGWAAIIFLVSGQSRLPDWAPSFDFQDIVGHFVAYGGLTLLLRRALTLSGARNATWWALLFAVFYGLSDEFHQSFVPGRHSDPLDLAVDAIGAGVALLGRAWFNRSVRRPRPR